MVYFDIKKYLVTTWGNIISINDIVTLNETIENLSAWIVKLTIIDGLLQENEVVIFQTCQKY